MVTADEIRDLLNERPDLKEAIKSVLSAKTPFEFADLDINSGQFGELVSRNIVEKSEGGYTIVDRQAIERGLSGDFSVQIESSGLSLPSVSIDRLELFLLIGCIGLLVVLRLVPLQTVFREGHVVLSSNDPYFYRYLVETLLSTPSITPSSMPEDIRHGEPLMVTTLWVVVLALGGTNDIVGHVLAWYPVISAVVTGFLVYVLAIVLTEDRRIGLSAVAILAVIPGHALRTNVGFADHHAFDYPWIVLTLLGVVVIARGFRDTDDTRTSRRLFSMGAIGIGVAGQTLAWNNGPLLIVPIGFFLAADVIRVVHQGVPFRRTSGPVLGGVVIGALITWATHAVVGWHTNLVASAPLLLAIGGGGVLFSGWVITAVNLRVVHLIGTYVMTLMISILALVTLTPSYWTRLTTRLGKRLFLDQPIAETAGLFSESGGWLLLLGFALFVGLPYIVWGAYRSTKEPRWLAPSVYGLYFTFLAIIQVRFVGELAPILAIFAGFGLVHLAERVDLAQRPSPFTGKPIRSLNIPEPLQIGQLALIFLLVSSLGLVQTPLKLAVTSIPPAQSDAAFWMADDSESRNLSYPDNYVFSEWDRNRLYNYFVSGESRSYGYAQGHFQIFVTSEEPETWYDRLAGRRGYVVTTPAVVGRPAQLGTRLHEDNGAGSPTVQSLARYRLVHVTGNGSYKVFEVVPGAVLHGKASPKETVSARTHVELQRLSFGYERRNITSDNGTYTIRVSQPGRYVIGNKSVNVPVTAVRSGTTVTVGAG